MPRGSARAGRGILAVAAWLVGFTLPLVAQTTGSVGVGGSVVEYDGFLASGAAVIAPAFRFDSPAFSVGGQGSWTLFESGSSVFQGSLAAALIAASRGPWRFELSGSAGASEYRNEQSSGHLLGGVRIHIRGRNTGGWVGAVAGRSYGAAGVPLELTAAGWSVKRRLTLLGAFTATLHDEVRYVDLVGTARWTTSRLEVEARVGARPWGRYVVNATESLTGAYAELSALAGLNRWISVTLSGGKYRADPVRRTLGANYISAGLRLGSTGRSGGTAAIPATDGSASRATPGAEGAPRLEVAGRGERRTLRIRAPNGSSAELMGDFTDWVPIALTLIGPGLWETKLAVPAGVHRVTIRLDGGPWIVPAGLRAEQTEFGTTAGVVVLP